MNQQQVGNAASTPVVNIQDFLNRHRFSAFQWKIFAFCFVIVLLDGFDTAAIGFIAPSLLGEWNLTRQALGPVLSAALFGLAAGALVSGPIADRIGRKLVLGVSVLLFGIACVSSSFAENLSQLTILRFVTGIGLGAAMPNAVTLMSEYCPDRYRSVLTNAMFCGFPMGAALGGFLAAWIIPIWGWRSVLMVGGMVPLCMALFIFLMLPESVRHMVARGYSTDRIRAVLSQISDSVAHATAFVMSEKVPALNRKIGLSLVLSRSYIVGSVMLWLSYFMGLVIFYSMINWMPILFKDAGLAPKTGAIITALFPLGGFGAIFLGWLMDNFNANRVIAIGYVLTAACMYAVGQVAGNVGLLTVVVFLAGTLMNTAQSSMPALAAAFYPTQSRATGVAWMLGIGRFGGIAGSLLIAELMRRQLNFSQIFSVVAAAGLISAGALVVKQFAHPEAKSETLPLKNDLEIVSH